MHRKSERKCACSPRRGLTVYGACARKVAGSDTCFGFAFCRDLVAEVIISQGVKLRNTKNFSAASLSSFPCISDGALGSISTGLSQRSSVTRIFHQNRKNMQRTLAKTASDAQRTSPKAHQTHDVPSSKVLQTRNVLATRCSTQKTYLPLNIWLNTSRTFTQKGIRKRSTLY